MKRYEELLKQLEQVARAFTANPSYIPREAVVLRDARAAIRELHDFAEKAEADAERLREAAQKAIALIDHESRRDTIEARELLIVSLSEAAALAAKGGGK